MNLFLSSFTVSKIRYSSTQSKYVLPHNGGKRLPASQRSGSDRSETWPRRWMLGIASKDSVAGD